MAEKKAVLNMTAAESLAAAARSEAATKSDTVSSVVEQALAAYLDDLQRRADGLAAIEQYYRESGYPTAEETAAAEAQFDDDMRKIAAVQESGHSASEDDGRTGSSSAA
jgi:hypothetical protein